ncbi:MULTISPECIES: hypothetical protein [unclassified Pseudomonas]|uniref:hypothetical protein n=1 Tax=unclassified Pseudomonas TaxID=196821 RepID=UPI000AD80EF8|nr:MULTISPECIES: hypothetical protein [unclassified Pseudomonas]
MRRIDISGLRFGRLLVIGYLSPGENGGSLWLCQCDCGNQAKALSSHLRGGSTRSCGCLASEWSSHMGSNPEFVRKRAEKVTKHGHKRPGKVSVEYRTWIGMKRRCYDVKCKDYPNWGGRGIKVCDRWNNSFVAFFEDMGPRPPGKYSIDRLDPDMDYSPENCRWATFAQQGAENRRGLMKIVVEGLEFSSIADACRHFGVNLTTAHYRINAGIPAELAVSTTSRLKPRRSRESYLPKSVRKSP